jgi:hypothetical protein
MASSAFANIVTGSDLDGGQKALASVRGELRSYECSTKRELFGKDDEEPEREATVLSAEGA